MNRTHRSWHVRTTHTPEAVRQRERSEQRQQLVQVSTGDNYNNKKNGVYCSSTDPVSATASECWGEICADVSHLTPIPCPQSSHDTPWKRLIEHMKKLPALRRGCASYCSLNELLQTVVAARCCDLGPSATTNCFACFRRTATLLPK